MPSNKKPCPKCGQPMHRQSPQCRACWRASQTNAYLHRECRKCGKEFRTHASQTARGGGLYCSKSCARSGSPARKRDYRLLSCANCGMPVERQFAELRRRKLGKAFCSSECWYAHAQRENNPVWTGGQHERINSYYRKWRKAVLERDFYECANCHSAERLEAHHIVRFNADASRRWDVTNGITLCRQCHQVIRGREEEYEKLLSFAANIPREVWS